MQRVHCHVPCVSQTWEPLPCPDIPTTEAPAVPYGPASELSSSGQGVGAQAPKPQPCRCSHVAPLLIALPLQHQKCSCRLSHPAPALSSSQAFCSLPPKLLGGPGPPTLMDVIPEVLTPGMVLELMTRPQKLRGRGRGTRAMDSTL